MKTTVIDMSGGCEHIREIATESGMDYMQYHSHEETHQIDGHAIETWYNEDASSAFSAWGAFIRGVGSDTAGSMEDAIAGVLAKAKRQAAKL